MHRNRYLKKGYILIYSLLLCSLCMLAAVYIFSMQVKIIKNANNYRDYIVNNKKYDEYKERLFTLLYSEIIENVQTLNKDNIRNYLKSNNTIYKTEDNNAKIEYDISKDKIILSTFYQTNYIRKDISDYEVTTDKLIFNRLEIIYEWGRID